MEQTKKKNDVGRPKVDTKKDMRITGYFTKAEYNALLQVAKNNEVSLSNLVRRSTLANIRE